ncbi:hypothetical protein [Paenibacillus polymyxa]|uniref:hypothetical protein n=1 Tax=Paenibacillus polymyxa TaxID=1406 RepID=UPI0004723D2C|nr:hypothetical protein [Paenibacillus polymyxa]
MKNSLADKLKTLILIIIGTSKKMNLLLIRDTTVSFFVDSIINELKKYGCNLNVVTLHKDLDTNDLLLRDGVFEENEIIVIFPLQFRGHERKYIHKFIQECEARRHKTILLDDPTVQVPEKYIDKVIPLFLKAINIDYNLVNKENLHTRELLLKGSTFNVEDSLGSHVTFFNKLKSNVFMENCDFNESETIFQLPGGEVFFSPDPYLTEGVIIQKYRNKREEIIIEKGYATFTYGEHKGKKVPVAEFGIGTNHGHEKLSFLSSFEKSLGTCHFGFGYNRNIEGIFNEDFHFDVVLNDFSLLIDGIKFRKRGEVLNET